MGAHALVAEDLDRAVGGRCGGDLGGSLWETVVQVLLQPAREGSARRAQMLGKAAVGFQGLLSRRTGDDGSAAADSTDLAHRSCPILRRDVLQEVDGDGDVKAVVGERQLAHVAELLIGRQFARTSRRRVVVEICVDGRRSPSLGSRVEMPCEPLPTSSTWVPGPPAARTRPSTGSKRTR